MPLRSFERFVVVIRFVEIFDTILAPVLTTVPMEKSGIVEPLTSLPNICDGSLKLPCGLAQLMQLRNPILKGIWDSSNARCPLQIRTVWCVEVIGNQARRTELHRELLSVGKERKGKTSCTQFILKRLMQLFIGMQVVRHEDRHADSQNTTNSLYPRWCVRPF